MPIVKSIPQPKFIRGRSYNVSDQVLVSEPEYSVGSEGFLVIKDVPLCVLKLSANLTDHITIKSLTRTLIVPLQGKIDEEFDEILLEKGSCIELVFSLGNWYITSSDGLKGI